jgi:hypothetical protein
MATLKLKPLLIENEINFLTSKYNRSTRRLLERKLNEVHNDIDKGSVKYTATLKQELSESRWNNLCNFVRPITGISEAGEMSDSDVAKAIAQVTKELTKGKMDIKPQDLDVKALDDPDAEPDELVKEVRTALNELGPIVSATLAAPSILKLVGNVADWVGSFLQKDASPEKRATTKLTNKLYKYAKKNKDKKTGKYPIPPKSEIVKTLGLSGDDGKYVDAVFKRIAEFTHKDNVKARAKSIKGKNPAGNVDTVIKGLSPDEVGKYHAAKFNVDGTETQYVDEHVLHIMYEATFDTTFGRSIGKAAHQLHELFLIPFKHVIAGAMWLGTKAKIGVKKGWNWLKGKLGMDSEEVTDVGLSYKEAYDKADRAANVLYTCTMISVALYGFFSHGFSVVEAKEKLTDVLSNAKDSNVVIDIANALKSSIHDTSISMIDGIKAGDLTATEIAPIVTDLVKKGWDAIKG